MQFKHLLFSLSTILICLVVFFFLLTQKKFPDQHDKVRIVCTTTIIADTIQNITGNHDIDLKILMGPGVDPHTYKPVEQDIITITNADIIFYNGLHLEARMANIFEQLQNEKKTIAVTQDIPKDQLIYSQEFKEFPDPHVWFDPQLWICAVQTITKYLQDLIPQNFDRYEKNKNNFIKQIQIMHRSTHKTMLKIPLKRRILITGHDAFSYFARAYDCKVISLQGISTASEAGTCDVQNLINLIVLHKIPTIFAESCTPTRNMQALIQGAASYGWQVQLGQELFSDALGSSGTLQGTYLGMFQYNVESIATGLNL